MEAKGRDQRILEMGYHARQGGHGVLPMSSIPVLIGQMNQGRIPSSPSRDLTIVPYIIIRLALLFLVSAHLLAMVFI